MGKIKKQAPIFKSLLVALLAISQSAALSAPTNTNTSFQTTVEDRSASEPTRSPALLALAVQAAAEGDKATLSKLYKLSLLVDQKARGEGIRKALRESLAASHTAAKGLYAMGDLSGAIGRLRLVFNLAARLTQFGHAQQLNEVDDWVNGLKIMSLPKDDCIAALNDYGLFLNCSGQYDLAIPVLKAVIEEAPSRAAAYVSLADAQAAIGKRSEAAANYRHFRDLTNKSHGHPLTPNVDLQTWAGKSEIEANNVDLIAVLSTKGQLKNTDSSSASSETNGAAERPSVLLTGRELNDQLPWLESDSAERSVIAVTDQPARLWHRNSAHKRVSQTVNRQILDLNDAAVLALRDCQPEDAIKTLNEALDSDPGCLLTLANLAIAFNSLALQNCQQPKVALKSMHQALALVPWSNTVRSNTNAIIREMGKDPHSFKVRLELAHESMEHHDYLGALVECREALRLRQDNKAKAMLISVTEHLAKEELLPTKVAQGID